MTHFSHLSLTTEMDSSLVPVSFRTLYDFDLNEAIGVYDSIDVYDFITERFYCRRKSFEYLNSPKLQFVKSRKLSDLCSKIYEKWLN